MAEVNEIVTVFKFKGDTKPLKEAGDGLQEVSENSGIAEKRMGGASEAMEGMGKSAMSGLAGVVSLGSALAKITQTVFDLGQETSELKGLGIDPVEFRETEDLFSKLGADTGDAENFVKKITEAQNQLSLGKDSPFARSLQEQFGVLINEGDKVGDVLSRLREATEKQGFTAGQISVKAGELGFSPKFSKVLLATNNQFAVATKAAQDLAKADAYLLDQSEATSQAMKDLGHSAKRLFELFSLSLAPAINAVVFVLQLVVDGWTKIFTLSEELLLPVFTKMWELIDKYVMPAFDAIAKFLNDVFLAAMDLAIIAFNVFVQAIEEVIGAFKAISDFLSGVFLAAFEAIIKVFDFFVKAFEDNVMPVVKLLVGVFFDIVDAIREAISKIPFVGDDEPFVPMARPSFASGNSSSSSSSSNSSNTTNSSSTHINIDGLSTEQIDAIMAKAMQKKTSLASGAF